MSGRRGGLVVNIFAPSYDHWRSTNSLDDGETGDLYPICLDCGGRIEARRPYVQRRAVELAPLNTRACRGCGGRV